MRRLEEDYIDYSGVPPEVNTLDPGLTSNTELHQSDGGLPVTDMAPIPLQPSPVEDDNFTHGRDQSTSELGQSEIHATTTEASTPVRSNYLAFMTGIVHYLLHSPPTPEHVITHVSRGNMSPGNPHSHEGVISTPRSETPSPTHPSQQHALPVVAQTEQTHIRSHVFVGIQQLQQRHTDIRDIFCSPVLLLSPNPKICQLLAALECSSTFPSLTAAQKSNTHVAQSSVPHPIGSDRHCQPSQGYRPFPGVYLTLCPDSPGPSQDVVYPADEEAVETSILRRRQHLSIDEPIFVLYITIQVAWFSRLCYKLN